MRWAFLFIRLLLGGVFLFAGIVKSASSDEFALALIPFTILPDSWLGPISLVLPWVEVLLGLLIITGPKRPAAVLIFLLCLAFCFIIGWALQNGIIVSCACFGRDETPSAWKMQLALARDIALALLAAAVFCEDWILRRR